MVLSESQRQSDVFHHQTSNFSFARFDMENVEMLEENCLRRLGERTGRGLGEAMQAQGRERASW